MEVNSFSLGLIPAGVLFGILQITFLIYFFSSSPKREDHRIFILFLVVLLITQSESFLNRSGLMSQVPHFLNISTPFIFLLGPLLYLYSKNLLQQKTSSLEKALHFIPFIFYLAYSFFFFLQPVAYKYNAYVNGFQPGLPLKTVERFFSTDPLEIQGLVVVEGLSLHILIYAILTIQIVKSFRSKHPNSRLNWLFFVNGLLAVAGLVLLLAQGGVINDREIFPTLIPNFSADLFPTFATYTLTFYVIKNREFINVQLPKYYKSGISKEHRSGQLQRILDTLESKRLYIEPDFSLQKLGDACKLSTHHLSQILNEEMGYSFFDLTNHYRIADAKRLLTRSNEHIKIEQLAYDLGYKSKSTFFNAFKKDTLLTPSKYREINLA